MTSHPLRVLLVEDHTVVRAGVRALLDRVDGIDVVAEAASVGALDGLDVGLDVDVVVTDLVLPDASGPRVVAAVRQRFPDRPVLVLTMVSDVDMVEAVLRAGATGYLLKDAASTELVDAIRVVAVGGGYVQPSLGAMLARPRTADPADLSDREKEVLGLIALGHTNTEIADLLHFSVRTIEAERNAVSAKIDARTRADLVRYAIEHGYLRIDGR